MFCAPRLNLRLMSCLSRFCSVSALETALVVVLKKPALVLCSSECEVEIGMWWPVLWGLAVYVGGVVSLPHACVARAVYVCGSCVAARALLRSLRQRKRLWQRWGADWSLSFVHRSVVAWGVSLAAYAFSSMILPSFYGV